MVTGKKCKLGDNIMNYVEGERMEMLPELFKRVMKGMTEEMEACMDTPEGEKWFHSSYFPIRDENNQVTAFCVTSKDITERKLTEHALNRIRAEREEYQFRLQSMLDNSPSIVFIKDLEGRYLIINKAFRNALCLTDEQVIGKTDFDFDRSEMAAHFKKTDDEVVNTLRSIEMEESFDSATGRQNFLFVKFPLFDKENRIYGIGGIATDLTENMENRQKLIAARKKAEKAEQLQEQFLANMSHEIRTPMNGITGMTNILMTTELDEQQQEYVKIIKQSSDNLLVLINDILDLSKIKSGKLSLEKMDFNLRETLDFTLAPFYLKAKERNISLQLMQDSALPGMINGDPYRLAQILNNLLSNALKFTERGTIRLHVKIKPEKEDVLEFSVTDTGIGIPADKLVSIFNSFEQASSSTTRKFGGTGLGLTITKKLVELLEGEINVTSVPGEGTSFNFTIPYEIIQKDNDMKTIQGGASTSDTAGLANKKILVVEDNEINQKVISLILGKQGIKTEIAENGKVAVDRLEEGNVYDLIIMDLHMPVMDGFQAATYMRQKLKITIPIIAMTASVLGNERARCFELGMDEYLSKPFVPAELFVTLKRFLTAPLFTPMQVVGSVKPVAKLYDLTYLRSMDDKKYLCEILELFLNTTPTILEELQNDVLSEHWDSIEKKAHKLKSSLGILQMNEIMELVSTIEIKAKERLESDKIQQALKLTIEQFGLVRPMLESELAAAS
jgi:PAS domain S-box-containing protein